MGEIHLTSAAPHVGSRWTNDGSLRENRALKHRIEGESRPVPMPPQLVAILRTHLVDFPDGAAGRLFYGVRAETLPSTTYMQVWRAARKAALTPREQASPLGVDLDTAVLPDGWRDRLVKVQNANTAPAGEPRFTGWCLDKEDLCVAKLIALREKDYNFVAALLVAGLVNADVIAKRLSTVSGKHPAATERALGWLDSAP